MGFSKVGIFGCTIWALRKSTWQRKRAGAKMQPVLRSPSPVPGMGPCHPGERSAWRRHLSVLYIKASCALGAAFAIPRERVVASLQVVVTEQGRGWLACALGEGLAFSPSSPHFSLVL